MTEEQIEDHPVAYQYRWRLDGEWTSWRVSDASQKHRALNLEERPLYAALATVQPVVKPHDRDLVDELTGALRFILAFYEPGQTYLDTNAWKQAEAGGRRALARGEAAIRAAQEKTQ